MYNEVDWEILRASKIFIDFESLEHADIHKEKKLSLFNLL